MTAVVDDMTWLEVGTLDEIPRQGARVLKREGGDIAVFRTAADEVFALLNRCPHRGGPLSEGILYGRNIVCPLHNWCLDLASGEAKGPDEGCAPAYATRIEAGRIFVCAEPIA